MVSYLLWILAVVGALFWVVFPAGILVMAFVCRGEERRRHTSPDGAETDQRGQAVNPRCQGT